MSICVTGCAGFIGSRVAALLLDQGRDVVGVDNLNDAYDVRLKDWRLAQLEGRTNFRFHRLDITDRAALNDLFSNLQPRITSGAGSSNLQSVINLAARAGVRQSVKDPWVYYQTNVIGTLNLLEACREHGIMKFVQASTSSVYGNPTSPSIPPLRGEGGRTSPLNSQFPTPNSQEGGPGSAEHQLGPTLARSEETGSRAEKPSTFNLQPSIVRRPFRESDPTDRPLSPYAASKKAAEELCHSYHHLYGMDITVLRFFTVYGPAGRPDMSIFRFIKWIDAGEPVTVYGDGTQERDFTYVDDIARGTAAALNSQLSTPNYEVINLGSDRPVALREVIGQLEQLVGEQADLRYEPTEATDVPATWADISKARCALNWSPQTSLEDGLAAAVDWYRHNRSWVRLIPEGGK